MSVRNLEHFFQPRSVALVGVGRSPTSLGHIILRNIISGGFAGKIGIVHPTAKAIAKRKCAPSVAALPFVPDLAIISTPPQSVVELIAAFAKRGTKAVVVITAGFGEGGDAEGHARRDAMLAAARPQTMRIIGPNCFGILSSGAKLNASFSRMAAPPGHLALVAQSGAIAAALIDWALPRRVGCSLIATLGDMADVDIGDMLDYLATDPQTRAILLYVEGITNPRKFMSAARAAARVKPVIVIKSGRHAESGKAAASHTGAIAGSDAVYDAAFARAGLLRVNSLEDLFDAATALDSHQQIKGDRLAILTNGGGAGVLAVDALLDFGGQLAELSASGVNALNACLPPTWSHGNPVDIIGDADGERYERALRAVLAEPNADAVLVMHCPTAMADPNDIAKKVAAAAQKSAKPMITAWLGDESVRAARTTLAKARIPTFRSPRAAVEGFARLVEWRRRRDMLMETPAAVPDVPAESLKLCAQILAAHQSAAPAWLPTVEAKRIISAYGIPTAPSVFAADRAAVERAAADFACPVAIKIVSPDIVHKSDVGGVILSLADAHEAGQAYDNMLVRVRDKKPGARISGVIVEKMIEPKGEHELFLGMTVDKTFGPVIAFGHGGVAVEAINDKALGLPPLNPQLARRMIDSTRIARLLRGYRHVPAANIDKIMFAIVRLSQLVLDHPSICDMDINPLLAGPDDMLALDVRIQVDASAHAKPVIHPYPRELEQRLTLRDGTELLIRPIRPDDEESVRAMVRQLAPDDVRFRFFLPLRDLDHPMAARLTQIDYDREMAFVCTPAREPATFWAIGRLHCDPNIERGEYALTVRSDMQGRGLGWTMMQLLLDEAKRRGLKEVWGDVLRDNLRMLKIAKRFGFSAARLSGDASIVRTTLALHD